MTNPRSSAHRNALASFKDEAGEFPEHLLSCKILGCPVCEELKKHYSVCGICHNEVFHTDEASYVDDAGERVGPRCWIIACKQDETTAQALLHKHEMPTM